MCMHASEYRFAGVLLSAVKTYIYSSTEHYCRQNVDASVLYKLTNKFSILYVCVGLESFLDFAAFATTRGGTMAAL